MLNKAKKLILGSFGKKQNKDVKEVLIGALIAFSVKICAVGVNFGHNVVIANYLGPADTGKFFLALSVTSIAVIFAKFGTDVSILRYLSPEAANGNWGKVKGIYLTANQLTIIIAIGITAVTFFGAGQISTYFFSKPELEPYLKLFSLGILPIALTYNATETFRSLKKIRYAMSLRGIYLPFFAILGTVFLAKSIGLSGAIIGYIGGALIISIAAFFQWRKFLRDKKDPVVAASMNSFFHKSRPFFWQSFFQQSIIWGSTIILGIWVSDSELGNYEIAKRIARLTSFFLIAFTSILAPKLGELYAKNDIESINLVCKKTTLFMTVFSIPAFILLYLFPEFFLSFFGKGFGGEATLVLQIILIGQFVNIAFGPVEFTLNMCGREKIMRNIVAASALVIVVSSLILIPLYGVIGGAIAFSLSLIFKNFASAFWLKKELNIITIPFMSTLIK